MGKTAASLLSRRTTANVERIAPGQCRYTFLLDATGAIVDDLLITRVDAGGDDPPAYLVVPNAAHARSVYDLLRQHRHPDTEIHHLNGAVAILAVQGPQSRSTLETEFGWSLEALGSYHGRLFPLGAPATQGREGRVGARIPADLKDAVWVSRTGYTGELGYELFVSGDRAIEVAERLEKRGAMPCGLGARDTLRLEKGYLLSGQDFHRDRSPLEAAQDRFVEFDHPFVGREALEAQRKAVPARLTGLLVETPGAIPRHGTPVLHQDAVVGVVTSGGLSPTLQKGIALVYLPPALAVERTDLSVELRGQRVPARVVPLPFLRAAARR